MLCHTFPAFVAAEEGLQGQHHTSLSPSLHGGQVIHRILGHAEGQTTIDELGSPAPKDLLKTTGRVFHLAALMECSAFDILLTLALALHVTDAPPLFLPHQISRRVTNHPCAICSTRTHASTAISNHAIQAEELGVVVIQVIQLVLHLVEELRALSEAYIRVQLHVIVKEVGDGGVEEIGLELVTSIANAVEARVVVPLIVVHVLRPVGVQAQIVLGEIQSSCFAATGSERNVVHEGIIILHTIHHLLSICTKFQPILVLCIHWDLVVPSSWSNMLGLDGSLIFNGFGSGQVVHSQGQAVPIFGLPVSHIITFGGSSSGQYTWGLPFKSTALGTRDLE